MTDNVFERREKKYLVGPEQRRAIERAAEGRLAPDAYGRTLITSVYLDTPGRSIIARSLEKPLYKEKLRLRAYGSAAGEALVMLCRDGLEAVRAAHGDAIDGLAVYFGLKKKFDGIVYKRRVRLSLQAAWAFAHGASFEAARTTFPLAEAPRVTGHADETTRLMSPRVHPSLPLHPLAPERDMRRVASPTPDHAYFDRQIARELEAALARYDDLRPSAAILCWRTAWTPVAQEGDLRLTFDDDLRFIDLTAEGAPARAIVSPEESIMELKAGEALPSWLIDALSSERVYPRSFSKYGEAARIMAAHASVPASAPALRRPMRAPRHAPAKGPRSLSRLVRVPHPVRPLKKGA